jgi:hypothetical protein
MKYWFGRLASALSVATFLTIDNKFRLINLGQMPEINGSFVTPGHANNFHTFS